MEENEFWALMKGLNPKDRSGSLKRRLAKLPPERIVAFQSRLDGLMNRAYDTRLWAAASLMCMGWCSDDMFEYFRAGLIARGETIFTSALANPDSMAEWAKPGEWVSDELVVYAPAQVYEEATGREMEYPEAAEPFRQKGKLSVVQNRKFWKRSFPNLHELFAPSVRY